MTDYYIDYNRGNDSNAGTSTVAAWQNLSKLARALSAGDTVSLASDSVWDFETYVSVTQNWSGTAVSPILITSYDPGGVRGDGPTIKCRKSLAAGDWTYDAPNAAWYYDDGKTVGSFPFVLLGGEYGIQANTLPLSADNDYINSGTKLYVYAPAGTNPTEYYGSVVFGSSSWGAITAAWHTWHNVIIEKLRFEASGTGIKLYGGSGGGTKRLTIRECRGYETGMLVETSAASGVVFDIDITDCVANGSPVPFIHPFESAAGGHVARILRNRLTRAALARASGAIYIQANNIIVAFNDISGCPWGTRNMQSDGCGIYAEVNSHAVSIVGNWVHDQHLAFQDNSGKSITFSGNLVTDCYAACYLTDQDAIGATDHRYYNNTHVNLGTPDQPEQGPNVFAGIGWRAFTNGLTATIQNNIFHAYTIGQSQPAIETPVSGAGVISHNCAYGFSGVAAAYTGAAASPTPSNSITSDPLLDASYRLRASSPCVGAGVYLENAKHYGSCAMNPVEPDIGAHRWFDDRAVISRSVTSRSVGSDRRIASLREVV